VSQKEMDAAFSMDFTEVYKPDYGRLAAQTCSTSEKPPFSGARSWFLLMIPMVADIQTQSKIPSKPDYLGWL